MIWIDAHCHLANLAQAMPMEAALKEAQDRGIKGFLSNALTKAELKWYEANAAHYGIAYSAGIHPHFAPCDLEYKDIERLCQKQRIWAVGEIGLDRMNKDFSAMRQGFIRQLELAAEYTLPVVLHIVGHQQAAYEILREYPLRYLIHGYAGSTEAFRLFLKLDAYFTLSERLLKKDKRLLLSEMLASKRYFLETDITRYYVKPDEVNPLLRLIDLAEIVSQSHAIDICELKATQYDNYLKLRGNK